MPQDAQPLQTDELVKFLYQHQECAIIHRETGHEVDMFTDLGKPERPWYASYVHYDILERDLLKQALAIGFKLRARDCTDYAEYELYQNCHGITIAAIRALRLARMLPGVAP